MDAGKLAGNAAICWWERLTPPCVLRPTCGIKRPWDFRAARRGLQSQPVPRPQRPVNLTIINAGARPSSGRRWYCRTVGSWEHAQELLRQGHTYLDGDSDGKACEALR